jgi:hypothetical protein
LFKGYSAHYGVNHFLYFFDYGIPFAVGLWFVFVYFGFFINVFQTLKKKRSLELPLIILNAVLLLSLSKHKEVRFLLAVYPIFPIYAAVAFERIVKFKKIALLSLILILLTNYVSTIDHGVLTHCGAVKTMDYIRNYDNPINKILFMTRCHDFPYYGHVHK